MARRIVPGAAFLLFYYDCSPAVLVLLGAVLYAAQMVVEACRHRTRLAVFAEDEALASVKVVYV